MFARPNTYMSPIIDFTFPKILFHKKTDDGFECGPFIRDLDTGIYYSEYDYGKVFQISLFGIGIRVTLIYL